jgi:drug/metabolite transporter (DMT)-like permease
MIWLILSIVTSSFLYVIFKGFEIYKVNTLHAIVINYLVAGITGLIAFNKPIALNDIYGSEWLWVAAILGLLFIVIFNFMALTSQKNGLSVAAIASKMSLIIPVIAGVWLYNEDLDFLKLLGIIVALIAVYLSSAPAEASLKSKLKNLTYPIILFLGSGAIDTLLKYAQETKIQESDEPIFSAVCFFFAFILGIIVLVYEAFSGRFISLKSLLAGVILGIPNYFSIYFIIQALKTDLESSTIFPINHVGTVLFTTALGIFLFAERTNRKNIIGIVLAVCAIVIIAFAKANN